MRVYKHVNDKPFYEEPFIYLMHVRFHSNVLNINNLTQLHILQEESPRNNEMSRKKMNMKCELYKSVFLSPKM